MTTPLGGGSWAGGWDEPGVLSIVLIEAGTTGAGLFVYSGTPALGNLIASITAASPSGTDLFGNTTYPGLSSYNPNGTALASSIAELLAGQLQIGGGFQFEALGGSSTAAITVSSAQASGSEAIVSSGTDSSTDSPASVTVGSADIFGLTPASFPGGAIKVSGPVQILDTTAAPPAGFGHCLWTNANGTPSVSTNHALSGQIPVAQTDFQTRTNTNLVAETAITKAWSVPAGDMLQGDIYELEVPWQATMEGNALQLGLSIDGAAALTPNTFSGTIVGAGLGINGTLRAKILVTSAPSATGTISVFLDGTVVQTGATLTFTNSGAIDQRTIGHTFDTTVAHTFAITSLWGGANASETVSGYGSKFTRTGP